MRELWKPGDRLNGSNRLPASGGPVGVLVPPVLKSKHLRAQTELEDERHSNRKHFCSSFSENYNFFSALTFWSRNPAETRLQWHKFENMVAWNLKSKHLKAQTKLQDERHGVGKHFYSSFGENSQKSPPITFWSRNRPIEWTKWVELTGSVEVRISEFIAVLEHGITLVCITRVTNPW